MPSVARRHPRFDDPTSQMRVHTLCSIYREKSLQADCSRKSSVGATKRSQTAPPYQTCAFREFHREFGSNNQG